ncbi:hypothetical protein [Haliangium ochraceum]|nr:hypothetical protein [Haliangium ochraceum]
MRQLLASQEVGAKELESLVAVVEQREFTLVRFADESIGNCP